MLLLLFGELVSLVGVVLIAYHTLKSVSFYVDDSVRVGTLRGKGEDKKPDKKRTFPLSPTVSPSSSHSPLPFPPCPLFR